MIRRKGDMAKFLLTSFMDHSLDSALRYSDGLTLTAGFSLSLALSLRGHREVLIDQHAAGSGTEEGEVRGQK